MGKWSNEQKRKCAEREVKQRKRVYANLVAQGRMEQEAADAQISMMEEIQADYAFLVDMEARQGKLFG